MSMIMAQVRAAQPEWFSRGNKRFFGDCGYKVLQGKVSSKPFLVRSTYAWTDMFGAPKTLHYRINPLNDNLIIGNLVDETFRNINAVKDWLANN